MGKLVATGPANRFARLYTTRCLTEIAEALAACNNNYSSLMHLSPEATKDLQEQSTLLVGCKAPIFDCDPDMEIKTDASEDGWGVFAPFRSDSYRKFGGRWAPEQDDTHINTLETMASAIGLEYALQGITGKHIRLRSDNTTAVSVIRKQGDLKCPERNSWVQRLWRFLQKHDLWLTVTHIPGIMNVEADEESRYFRDAAEWGLTQKVLSKIFHTWSTPDVDMFASNRNAVLPRYASWGPDPAAEFIDSFMVNWNKRQAVR